MRMWQEDYLDTQKNQAVRRESIFLVYSHKVILTNDNATTKQDHYETSQTDTTWPLLVRIGAFRCRSKTAEG